MNLQYIFRLGYHIGYLERAVRHKYKIKSTTESTFLDSIKSFAFYIQNQSLVKSSHKEVKQWIEKLAAYPINTPISDHDSDLLLNSLRIWDDRIDRELSSLLVKRCYQDGLLNFKRLIKGAKEYLDKDIWNKLEERTHGDLNDAVKCLLFELPTPAAMIALRATEEVLRLYYEYKTGNTAGQKYWKSIINELLKKGKDGKLQYNVDDKLVGHLDFIRENRRNLAEHPDTRFTPDQADRVFMEVTTAIQEMFNNMKTVS